MGVAPNEGDGLDVLGIVGRKLREQNHGDGELCGGHRRFFIFGRVGEVGVADVLAILVAQNGGEVEIAVGQVARFPAVGIGLVGDALHMAGEHQEVVLRGIEGLWHRGGGLPVDLDVEFLVAGDDRIDGAVGIDRRRCVVDLEGDRVGSALGLVEDDGFLHRRVAGVDVLDDGEGVGR